MENATTLVERYADYLKGFEPVSIKHGSRSSYYYDEQFGASVSVYHGKSPKSSVQYQISIWSGYADLFKEAGGFSPLYNKEQNAFALIPSVVGLRTRTYTKRSGALSVCCKSLVEQIYEKFHLTGSSNRLRTKRIGQVLFLYDPTTPI